MNVDPLYLLTIASVLVGTVGILLALGGIIAFLNVRQRAEKEARQVATDVAKNLSERITVNYLQRELPAIMNEYRELAANAVAGEQANEIARRESEDD